MLCTRLCTARHAVFLGVTLLVGPAHAQESRLPGGLSEMSLPGDIRAALAVIDDRAAADRSQFLLEFITRSYDMRPGGKNNSRDAVVRSLIAHLDRSSPPQKETLVGSTTLPLPLSSAIWTDVVFDRRATTQTLVSAILGSRNAALLYNGLLSLDDDTRAWLATQPTLIEELASRHSAAFLVAAPGLRVSGTAVRVPGGEAAVPAWEALVGRHINNPANFVRALVAEGDGRLAYFFGAMAQLTPPQVRLALNLESRDVTERIATARRLHAIFEHMDRSWKIDERVFWRPPRDPALLIADLRVDDKGRPVLPGTRRFWSAVFADADQGRTAASREDDPVAVAEGEPVDFAWLCEQLFNGERGEQRRRYQLVLFASRVVRQVTPETARDAIDAIRAVGAYPALIASLERAKLVDPAIFASAARRADKLAAIDDDARAVRALAQFQGALALLTRAALRGSLPAGSLSKLVSSLSAVDVSEQGDYEGRLVRWLVDWNDANQRASPSRASNAAATFAEWPEVYESADGLDRDVFRFLAGPPVVEPRFVDWEGTRYRLDLAAAEATRLARMLGERPRPYLSSASALAVAADALGEAGLTRDRLQREAGVLERVAKAVRWEGTEGWEGSDVPDRYREVAAALLRAARDGDVDAASRLAPPLRVLADDLLGRGLLELAYAAALGQPDRALISAADAAGRHDFGLRSRGADRGSPWRLPGAGVDITQTWHVTGSLLGLDVKLAELSLKRVSARPPSRKPTLSDEDRRVLIEAVALVETATLTDPDRDAIVEAIRKGRTRVAAVRTPNEAVALADEIRLSPARRTLLPWVVAHEPERAAAFLSPIELFWLGLEKTSVEPRFHAWGAPGEPRLGCLCLQMMDRRPWESLAGRRNSGILASGFPDLNLRLAELLAELKMPASLLGPVLASATLDFVNTVTSRDPDDRRGLVEFVQAVRAEHVEQYLALLTTDGPLVPISDATQATAGVKTGGPR